MKTITICGSMDFNYEMKSLKSLLEKHGFLVIAPERKMKGKETTGTKIQYDVINTQYKAILQSDAILVANYAKGEISNYIGANTLMEIGFAHVLKKDIFLLNPIPETSFKPEIKAVTPIIIEGNIQKISDYYTTLDTVYVSSDNIVKLRAVAGSFQKFGYRVNVLGMKTASHVSEQPVGFEETLQGAQNRLKELKTKVEVYQYLVSIESGIVKLFPHDNYYGFSICLIEDPKGSLSEAVVTEMAIPKEMTDLVPSKYPDLGILVQQDYGVKEKDPYILLSNGHISRSNLLERVVETALSQLKTIEYPTPIPAITRG